MGVTKEKLKKMENSVKMMLSSKAEIEAEKKFQKEVREFKKFKKTKEYKQWRKLNEERIRKSIKDSAMWEDTSEPRLSEKEKYSLHEYIVWRIEKI